MPEPDVDDASSLEELKPLDDERTREDDNDELPEPRELELALELRSDEDNAELPEGPEPEDPDDEEPLLEYVLDVKPLEDPPDEDEDVEPAAEDAELEPESELDPETE